MFVLKKYISKLTKFQKITFLILILGFALLLTIGIPTLARYKNRTTITGTPVWDGTVASSYASGTGTQADPYIISDGSELAYFSNQLSTYDYANTYFKLSKDIVLNKGVFSYDETNGIKYIFNNETFYIKEYNDEYYDNIERTGIDSGTVNLFTSLNGFKGYFDGNSYTIYGVYITNETNEELSLFTDLEGTVNNLYVQNSIIYGGTYTGGISSKTKNASLSNVLFSGNVIGRKTNIEKTINIAPTTSIINMENTENTDYIDLANDIPFVGSEITSTSITGNYVITGASEENTTIKINGTTISGGSFNVGLGTDILTHASVSTYVASETGATLTFSNLSYNVTYKYGVAGGISAYSDNVTLENTINKGYISGYSIGGGLIGVTIDTTSINQSYNTGNIDSGSVSGGLIGVIEKSSNNITISKSYNSGDMTGTNIGGLIGYTKSNIGIVSLTNLFNATEEYSIGTINNTTVNVSNSYYTEVTPINSGTIAGTFTQTSLTNLKNKTYVTTNLSYNEFVDYTDLGSNSSNVWVYEESELPILFIDDINTPIATIHASIYSWNNLSYELNTFNISSSIMFSIESTNPLKPIKEKYYYISNSTTPLTKTQVEDITSWVSYSDVVQISDEGSYVIYVKVVDYNDNVTYSNTDLLVLDFSDSLIDVNLDDNKWVNIRSELSYLYIDREKIITIDTKTNSHEIKSLKYYITDEVLTINNLNNLASTNWTEYSDGILINDTGINIVYIQITDENDNVTYINTDYIILSGYSETLTLGRNSSSYLNADPYITNKSLVSLNFSFTNTILDYEEGDSHNLMSNLLLPSGTRLTLIDKAKNKVYEYTIPNSEDNYNYNNSCNPEDLNCIKVATYPFTLFKEVGASTNKYFSEDDYYENSSVTENFTIILDLSNTSIETNYNDINLYMELHDSNGKNIRPTLYSGIKKFNIYSTVSSESSSATLNLTTDFTGGITYNSNSTTNVNITSGLTYKYINGYKITDTTYEDKEIGLYVKLVDNNGLIVEKENLKNFIFKIGDTVYYPGDDNIIRIAFNDGINDVTKDFTIITYENNSPLKEGTYYFKIYNYVSEDGYYYNALGTSELSIPVNVTNSSPNITYNFNVTNSDYIIDKSNEVFNITFNITQSGDLENPNIRIALFKKDELTAFNQDYSIIDLKNYISDNLNLCSGSVYYAYENPDLNNDFELNLLTANFDNTGYKFIFYLYDGNKKIGTIEKNFIVK